MTDYCIKPGYRVNEPALDVPVDQAFWTEERIRSAESFQIDVYRLARYCAAAKRARSVLDVGCGPPMKLKRFLAAGREVVLLDQAEVAPLAARILPAARFQAVDLSVADVDLGRTFDLVICSDVLEHLARPERCLAMIRRHLGPDSLAILSTPERDVLRGPDCMASPKADHVREWNRSEFRRFVEGAGFRVARQLLLPQESVPLARSLRGGLEALLGRPAAWWSCQTMICARAG